MRFSRLINRLTGGDPDETLCSRMVRTYGHDCLFCRVIAKALREPDHCWSARINHIKRR
jgi:hypothetical protein